MMEILIATTLSGIALLWFSTKTSNTAFQKLFVALGILLFAITFLQASILTPTQRLGHTEEYSFYWNCSLLRNTCNGTPDLNSCYSYDENTCERIPGCTWEEDMHPDPDGCIGTPSVECSWIGAYDPYGDACLTTDGCTWSAHEVEGLCDHIIINQEYEDVPAGNTIKAGNIALFRIFGMVLLLSLIWFIIDYMGIGLKDLGIIVKQRPKGWKKKK